MRSGDSPARDRQHADMDANEIQRQSRNAVRKGSILAVDHASALCRVSVGDTDSGEDTLETNWIPWFDLMAGATRSWEPPTDGEQVMLLCPMGDPAQGVALRGIYSDAAPAPSASASTHLRVYPDGAVVAYDHDSHALSATLPDGATVLIVAPGSVTVKTKEAVVQAENVLLDADQTTCTGGLLVKGPFVFESGMSGKSGSAGGPAAVIAGTVAVSEDVIAGGKSSAHHSHVEQGDGKPVSEPI